MPQEYDELPFQVDHIIAKQHGGVTSPKNLCLACFACNHHKGPNIAGFEERTGRVVPLFHPRRQKWLRHFRWDGPVLVGRTAAGRVTVTTLAINLPYRVGLRRELIHAGLFPTP
jgi:hypothetical protein